MRTAQVHRFRDRVAVYLPSDDGRGTTAYLTVNEARKLEESVRGCRLDVRRNPHFTTSEFETAEIQLEDPFNRRPRISGQMIQIRVRGDAHARVAIDALHGYSLYVMSVNRGWYTLRFRWTGPVKGLPGSAEEYLHSCNIHPVSIRHVAPWEA